MNTNKPGVPSIETALLHLDRHRNADTGAVHTPIHPSVLYAHPNTESLIRAFQPNQPGFTYARQGNPTNAALEAKVSLLEGARDTIVFSTGMGAISATFFSLLDQGAHIVCSKHVFGNTSSLLRSFERFGVTVDFVDATSADKVSAALKPETRFVFVETIANPGTEVADLEGIGALCRQRNILLVVDNSLTTPALIQPAKFGAGLVINSITKGFGGHGAAMGGAVSDTGNYDWQRSPSIDPLYRIGDPAKFGLTQIKRKGLRDGGATLRADDAHRLALGVETLFLRTERTSASAMALALWLQERPEIARVRYPGLESHPQHERAKRLFGARYGSLLSFSFKSGCDFASCLDRLQHVALATHLCDTRTLIIPVAKTIFAELGEAGRRAVDIDDGLVRLSVGLENIDDLTADFTQAFDHIADA